MRRALAWLAAAIAVAAVVMAFAPASLVASQIEQATRGRLRLTNVHGSIWDGNADAMLADGGTRLPVRWRLAAAPLLRGEAHLALTQREAGPGVRAQIVAQRGQTQVRDLEALIPAEALALPAGISAGGELRIASDVLALAADRAEGRVRVEWARARLKLPGEPPLALGTVNATLTPEGRRWRGPVSARGGALHIDGEAIVDANGAELALALVPQADLPEATRQKLGPLDAQGAARLRLTPRFR